MIEVQEQELTLIRKYLYNSSLSRKELKKYYNISKETAKKLKDKHIKNVIVNDEEYKSIKHILEYERAKSKIIVTDKIKKRTKALVNLLTVGYVGSQTYMNKETVNDIICGRQQYISLTQKKQINNLYNDTIAGKSKERLQDDCIEVDTKKVFAEEYKKVYENNKKLFKALKVGRAYNLYQERYLSKIIDKELIFQGTITKEYNNYYLGEYNGRKVTFLKNLLFLPDIIVEEVNNGEVSRISKTN